MRLLRLLPVMVGLTAMGLVPPALESATTNVVGQVLGRRVPHAGIQPEAVVDNAGTLHLIYFSGEPAGGDLYYVRSRDLGATFSTPVRINSQAGSAIATGTIRGGQLALGRTGRVHVVWNGSDAACKSNVFCAPLRRRSFRRLRKTRTTQAAGCTYGTNSPCRANTVLSAVAVSPSAPPS